MRTAEQILLETRTIALVRSEEARSIASEAGLDYVEDACTAVVHRRALR